MRKFSKRSIAVLTTAAIMASTASVVAYAETAYVTVNWTATEIVSVTGSAAMENGKMGPSNADGAITVEVASGFAVESDKGTVTGSGTTYTVSGLASMDTVNLTVKAVSTGSTSEPTPAGEENTDKVVWVNGKDTKASKDGTIPASLYKTEQFDQVMMSAGGKWQVAVTDSTIETVEAFIEKTKDGKFDAATAKASKEFASAKIKDGTVTVTAGKKAGTVNVWVYEVKNKAVVNDTFGEAKVEPKATAFTVKVAPTMVTTAGKTTVEGNAIKAIASPTKLEKGYDAGSEVTVYFGDKKADASVDATYVLWDSKNKKALELTDGKYVKEGEYTAELVAAADGVGPAVKITIDAKATEKTKIDVQVKNVESGKIAKIAPKVNKPAAKDDDKGGSEGGEEGGETPTPAPQE